MNPLPTVRRIAGRFPFTLVCVALIWYLCLFRAPRVRVLSDIEGFDKVVHVSMYLGTCCVFWAEYARSKFRWGRLRLALVTVAFPIAMSGVIELAQEYLTDYRSGDWMDFLANSCGVLLAWALSPVVKRVFAKQKS